MCTLALYFGVSPEIPLLVAANRDEFLARPSAAPRVLSDDPWVVAGQDLEAGGTWLGVNQSGMVVGLLNRRSGHPPDPNRSSRGLLCLRALQCRSLDELEAMFGGEAGSAYNPFTLLAASRRRALVAVPDGGAVAPRELPPGVHLMTNLEVNDPTCPRIARSHQLFEGVRLVPQGDALVASLRPILADHSTQLDPRRCEEDNALCIHAGPYGTRSSAIIALGADGRARFWHAEGPPCRSRFEEVPLPRT